jgi:hypothetical protein
MATATSELSDEIADPTPMRALRRISHIAGPVDAVSKDGLLLRAARYVALAPLVYRILAVPGAMAVFLTAHGGTGAVPVVLFTVCRSHSTSTALPGCCGRRRSVVTGPPAC